MNHVTVCVKDYDIEVFEVPSLKLSLNKILSSDLYYCEEILRAYKVQSRNTSVKTKKELELTEQRLVYDQAKKKKLGGEIPLD